MDSEGEYESALLGESDGAVLDAALPCLQHLTAMVSVRSTLWIVMMVLVQ